MLFRQKLRAAAVTGEQTAKTERREELHSPKGGASKRLARARTGSHGHSAGQVRKQGVTGSQGATDTEMPLQEASSCGHTARGSPSPPTAGLCGDRLRPEDGLR